MRSPFKFLDSYTAKDKDVFFGRDKEIETLYNLVHKTPLVLVYGLSGTGKTSLVQCGLSTRFDGPDWLPFHIRKEEDINVSLRKALNAALENKKTDNLKEAVDELFYTYFRPVYLIFDQFEELFILGTEQEQQKFMRDIRALLDAQLPCKVIFIMREEYIGEFYEFEKELPNIFDHKLRVEPMSNKRVREVMMQSFGQFNISLEEPADKLCQTMIDNISAGKSGIPLTYLQVYLDMLYREDFVRTYPNGAAQEALPPLEFTKEEVENFGEIDDVLDRYLKEQIQLLQESVSETYPTINPQSVKVSLDAFVTEEGTKRPVHYMRTEEGIQLENNVEKQISLPMDALSFQLLELEKARILRFGEDSIELAHDSLALLIDRGRTDEQRQLNDLRRRLNSDFKAWKETGEYLSRRRFGTYENYFGALHLSNELWEFVKDSWDEANLQEAEELEQKERELALVSEKLAVEESARRRQKRFSWLLGFALMIAFFISGMAFELWKAADESKKISELRTEEALRANEKTKSALNVAEKRKKEAEGQTNIAEAQTQAALDAQSETVKALKRAQIQTRLAQQSRSEADIAKDKAETAAAAAQNAALVLTIAKNNPTLALRIADYNMKKHSDNPAAVAAFREVINTAKNKYYKESFSEHSDGVKAVAFSPDGKSILTGRKDATAKLRDLEGNEIQSFSGHSEPVSAVTFSPDGKNILTGSIDKTAKLWDLQGYEIQSFSGHSDKVLTVAFSPDGTNILTGSLDKTAKLWDLQGNEIQSFNGHSEFVSLVTFSPDGKSILTEIGDGTAKLWDLQGNEIQSFSRHCELVLAVAFSPDGKSILTGSWDDAPKLWDLQGNEIQSFSGHSEPIIAVTFSPDGKSILTWSDKTTKLWDLQGNEIQSFSGHSDKVLAVTFSPDEKSILTWSDKTTKLWDLQGNEIQSFSGHSGYITAVTFSPDGKSILIGSRDRTAKLWDLQGNEIQSFSGHSNVVTSVVFSPDGKSILTGSDDNTTKLWDLQGNEIQSFSGHSESVSAVTFSPDGKSILTGSDDNTAKLWDLQGNEIQSFSGHSYNVLAVVFSPDGNRILTGSDDNTAKLWDLQGNEIQSFSGHSESVSAVTFSPDGKSILTGSRDRTAKLWDLEGNEIQSFSGHSNVVTSVVFSPDGKSILTGSDDNTAKLWLTPQVFLHQKVHKFTLQELYDAGTILTKEDQKKVKQKEK